MEFTCTSREDNTYKIYLEWDLLDDIGKLIEQHRLEGSIFVISDQTVFSFHGQRLLNALNSFQTFRMLVPAGETSKDLRNWSRIQDFLLSNRANRKSTVIAFGGGVVGDLVGFSASTFMRGLNFVQIPTTVLSQSDSSIGAKVAVNHPKAKNLIGSFYQPRFVLTDPSLLSTLPRREFAAGLGEAIKYGVIADPELFDLLYEHVEEVVSYNKEFLQALLLRCISIKIKVVEEDEKETGLRKILNFGHTIGHALEQATQYRRLRHGEAVAWGMLAAGQIAIERGMWDSGEFDRLKSILFRAGSLFPLGKLRPASVMVALEHDKKKTGKSLSFVLPQSTGKVVVVPDVQAKEAENAVRYILELQPPRIRARRSRKS